MFDVVALVCLLGQDPKECQPPTAHQVLELGTVSNELRCGIEGLQRLAQYPGFYMDYHRYYVKVTCLKREAERS